jgi:molecular chaperone DnaK
LRDKVAFELGVPGSIDVNPMTAVAEGASLYAESIDWNSESRQRKSTRGQVSLDKLALSFNYNARTPDVKAKIVAQLTNDAASGFEFQVDSIDTGWTSGRLPLKHGAIIDVTLSTTGDNTFKVFVFDSVGSPITLEQDRIIITRTAAVVNAIPASHSIAVEALEKLGGHSGLDYLVRAGDALPKKGKKILKAGELLKAGSYNSLNFNLWEGDIEDPVTDNRYIGVFKISGSDFDDGVIPAGADLECEYEMLDSGLIKIVVSVSCIGATFPSNKNFYSRQEGQLDYSTDAAVVIEEGEETLDRLNDIRKKVTNPKLDQARKKLEAAVSLDENESETEKSQEAMEKVLEARQLLAQVRKEHIKEIRQIDLDNVTSFFDKTVREYARPSEETAFDNLVKTAQRSIDRNDRDFEHHIDEMRQKNFDILWRQDWFVIERFKQMTNSPRMYIDKQRFEELAKYGTQLMRSDDIDKLRDVVGQLYSIKIRTGSDDNAMETVNIIRE